jgi:carbon-monoxide dehydrogenase large subunit
MPVSILGNRVLRTEDPRLLTEGGTYVDDLALDGAAHVVYVRSTAAHARLASVDTTAARSSPGVLGVFTSDDLDLGAFPSDSPRMLPETMPMPWLAEGTVRYVGEPVAAVVAETRALAVDAAEEVLVDYEPLPPVVDPEQAVQDDVVVHPAAGTNVAFVLGDDGGDDLFAGCEVVVRARLVNQRVAPCPLEVRAAAARWEDGRLVHWASSQGAHGVRETLRRGMGLERDQVRVVTPDVGGGFGAKGCSYPDELLLGWLARAVGRPVRWTETRSESMVGLGHGRGQVQHVELGGRRDGTLLAYRLRILQDAGAYPRMGAVLPFMTRTMASGVYAIPRVAVAARSVVTTTTPVVSYRGAGRPEATAAIERAVDLLAAEIGMDPVEVRRRNLIDAGDFPYGTAMGTIYDTGDYGRALDLVLEAAGYEELRVEQRRRREANEPLVLGIGLSVYVEITNPLGAGEYAAVDVRTDGTAVVRTGLAPHGQGHATALAMLVSDRLGIPLESVRLVHGDTDAVPRGRGTGGSRSLQVGGSAVHEAAGEVLERARSAAADLLEGAIDDVLLDAEGRFHVAGVPAVVRTWAEVAASVDGIVAEADFKPAAPTFPFGAHLAVVEVDMETGLVELLRLVAVDDAGRILNPLLVEGQVHGGLAQGVAQALFEEVLYDSDGNPLTTTLIDYAFPSAADLPSFETLHTETPTPHNPLGAKGIGESGTIGSTPAVQNAVVDALAHLGVRHLDMPATPERVWRAIRLGRP